MSRRIRRYLGFTVLIAGVGFGLETVHRLDRQKTTLNEFDDTKTQALSESRRETIAKVQSIYEMDAFLAEGERRENVQLSPRGASIKTDQEKVVLWSGGKLQAPVSLVYIHGFSASRLELEPAMSTLAKNLGANIFFTRLTAHGVSDGEEFANVRAREWAADVDEAIAIGEKIGERVILMGMSTGAALVLDGYHRTLNRKSLRPASTPLKAIAGLVLFSPNYALKDSGGFLLEGTTGPWMARRVLGALREFPVVNPLHGERWTTKYRTEGLAAMMTAVARVRQIDFENWNVPILTVYTRRDDVVSVEEIEKVSRTFPGTAELVDWPKAERHQLASAAFNPEFASELSDLVFEWILRKSEAR